MFVKRATQIRVVIALLVFPVLVVVFGAPFRLLAILAENVISPDVSWRDGFAGILGFAGLLGGVVGSLAVCRRMWLQAGGGRDRD